MNLFYLSILPLLLLVSTIAVESHASEESTHYLIEGVYYLIDQNQPSQATSFFQKAIALDPNSPEAYYFLGVSYYQLGQSIGAALFYLNEAEKRGIGHDQFRPDLIPVIREKYPDVQPLVPETSSPGQEVRIIVKSRSEKGGWVVIQDGERIMEYHLGESISLEGGKRYTMQFKKKGIGQFLKKFALVGAVLGILALR